MGNILNCCFHGIDMDTLNSPAQLPEATAVIINDNIADTVVTNETEVEIGPFQVNDNLAIAYDSQESNEELHGLGIRYHVALYHDYDKDILGGLKEMFFSLCVLLIIILFSKLLNQFICPLDKVVDEFVTFHKDNGITRNSQANTNSDYDLVEGAVSRIVAPQKIKFEHFFETFG